MCSITVGDSLSRAQLMFQGKDSLPTSVTTLVHHIEIEGSHHFGISVRTQEECFSALSTLKMTLLSEMRLDPSRKITQIVGDSQSFSKDGCTIAIRHLETAFRTGTLVLYGYTASRDLRDTNGLVTTVLREEGLLNQAIGNIVDQSLGIISRRPSAYPQLLCYISVFAPFGKKTEFGDDIPTSDAITDKFILLEGGVISFSQICNALRYEKSILAITGLRDETSSNYFSAAHFLIHLKEKVSSASRSVINDDLLTAWKDSYLEIHSPFDPKAPSAKKKAQLLKSAWNMFLECRLYEKLHLLTTITSESASAEALIPGAGAAGRS